MSDSYITHGTGGTCFTGTDAVRLFQATALRSGIGLLQKGIRPARGWTMVGALRTVSMYTGKKYKRTEAEQAKADLTVWINNMKLALPVNHSD